MSWEKERQKADQKEFPILPERECGSELEQWQSAWGRGGGSCERHNKGGTDNVDPRWASRKESTLILRLGNIKREQLGRKIMKSVVKIFDFEVPVECPERCEGS